MGKLSYNLFYIKQVDRSVWMISILCLEKIEGSRKLKKAGMGKELGQVMGVSTIQGQ